MPIYKYRAKKGLKDVVDGKIEASSERDAIEKLSHLGYHPMRLELIAEAENLKNSSTLSRVKIKSRQITIFSRQLASLLKAGVPILNSLTIISEQSESVKLKDMLVSINTSVKQGGVFSSALSQYPRVFSSLYIAMVKAGENSGALPEVLLRLADHRTKHEEMLSRIRMALAYPILMAIVGMGTVVFMLTFVMPRLMQIFLNMGQNLPLPTKVLISISNSLREWWLWIVLVLVVIGFIFRQQTRTKAGRTSLSLFKLHLPLFGKFILKTELSRLCRTLELLIGNGIPILKAIKIAVPVLENEIIKERLKRSYTDLEQGGSFGLSLKNSKIIPLFMSNLVIVGEKSGKLDSALSEVASSYERDSNEFIRIMSSLIEPLMVLAMGLIVGFLVVAMLLPIFEINIMAG